MGGQCFSIKVPNTDVTIQGGSGAVEGISLTTAQNVFSFSAVDTFIESGSDMKLASTGLLGAAGSTGVVVGTPASIQASAGGAVQIYAGAGITPDIGGPGGPGEAFGPSAPAQVNAGQKADALNRFNDGLKAVGDLASAGLDMHDAMEAGGAEGALGAAKGAFGVLKGSWDLANAASPASGSGADGVNTAMTVGETTLSAVETGMKFASGDTTGGVVGLAGLAAKAAGFAGGGAPMSGEEIEAATAAQQAIADAAAQGGHMSGPVDGPRIHEVAPANIDRECGADMTAKVAGNKTTAVDGKIEYTSGASISMKAFSKVETSSLNFEAYANVGATMKGLASAKVESLGQAIMEGKAKFKVSTMAKGGIEASTLTIEGKGSTTLDSPSHTIKGGKLEIQSETKITKKTTVEGITTLKNKLFVEKKTHIKNALKVDKKIQAGGNITTQAKFKNKNFSA
ncbi:MAG: hypothetical protein RLO52_18345 [Sandaracinaceae bacterium]